MAIKDGESQVGLTWSYLPVPGDSDLTRQTVDSAKGPANQKRTHSADLG